MSEEYSHHINEANKLLEQSRFTLQEVKEKLDFMVSDLWLVMERLKELVSGPTRQDFAVAVIDELLASKMDEGECFSIEEIRNVLATVLISKEFDKR